MDHAHYDFHRIRANAEYIRANIAARKSSGDVDAVLALHARATDLGRQADALRTERNRLGSSGGGPKAGSGAAAGGPASSSPEERQAAGRRIKEELGALEPRLARARSALLAAASRLPCDTHPDAPVGDESCAREILQVGSRRQFDFAPRDHVSIGSALGVFDMQAGASVTGSAFAMLTGPGVALELALVRWALDRAEEEGFLAVLPPDLARRGLVEACGFSPRGDDGWSGGEEGVGGDGDVEGSGSVPHPSSASSSSQIYSVQGPEDLCLIGTAEVPLAGLHAGSVLAPSDLPRAYAAFSHCFRREAGGAGRENRGLYRLHQFSKVELFAFLNAHRHGPLAASAAGAHVRDEGGDEGGDGKGEWEEEAAIADRLRGTAFDPARVVNKELLRALVHGGWAGDAGADRSRASRARPQDAATSATMAPGPGPVRPSRTSDAALACLVDFQARLLSSLGLHARALDMPTEELGAPAYRKVDLEAWMPGRMPGQHRSGDAPLPLPAITAAAAAAAGGKKGGAGAASSSSPAAAASAAAPGSYGEVTSASNCIDYQSRRLSARVRLAHGGQGGGAPATAFLHTLNATALAVPRIIVALLETHQQRDGSVVLPDCLGPYMGARGTVLRPKAGGALARGM